jgi:hypothetical protein
MTALELNTQKLKFVKEFLNEEDENVVKEQMDFFWETKHVTNIIPGIPRTVEDIKDSVTRGVEQYRQGKGITHAEFLKEQAAWKTVL